MCVCGLFVTYRVEICDVLLLLFIVFSVTVWFVCVLVCDGVWCVCACACFIVLFVRIVFYCV